MLAYNYDGFTNAPAPTGPYSGPQDDANIVTAYDGVPMDPYCCKGPKILEDGAPHNALHQVWRHGLSSCSGRHVCVCLQSV